VPTPGSIDRQTCMVLLASQTVGRVVYTDQALPAASPVRLSFHLGRLFMTTHDRLLAPHLTGKIVAVLVDDLEASDPGAWSVLVTGACRTVENADRIANRLGLPLAGAGVLEISNPLINGKRLALGAAPSTFGSQGRPPA
jgi:hypothetical protein